MKSDQELAQLIRSTFAGRAQDLPPVPAWAPDPTLTRAHPLRPWLTGLAAAAAVVGIVVAVTVARDHVGANHPANHNSPTLTPSPSGSPAPTDSPPASPSPTTSHTKSAPGPVALSVCSTTVPAAWRSALATSSVNVGGYDDYPLSVTPDGAVLALRDDGPAPGLAREVVELRPGLSPVVLYRVPNPDQTSVANADEVGHWLILGLKDQGRYPKGEIPGSSPIGLSAIAVVDLQTGRFTQVATAQNGSGGLSIQSTVIFDGKAYWDEESQYGKQTGVVKSYDPSTGTTRTVYSGAVGYLTVGPIGVISDIQIAPVVVVAATLPPIVAAALTPDSRFRLTSDGTSYAWLASNTVIGWWQPGLAAPTYVRLKTPVNTENNGGAPMVAGRFLIPPVPSELIDMKTKTVAPLSPADFGNFDQAYLLYSAHGLLLGGARATGNGKFVGGYWEDPPLRVLTVDTATLPDLTC
jgi:hypothetical protein